MLLDGFEISIFSFGFVLKLLFVPMLICSPAKSLSLGLNAFSVTDPFKSLSLIKTPFCHSFTIGS